MLPKRYPLPKPYKTDILTDEQMMFIAQQLPSPKATTGRPAYSNQELLPGILRVLRSGCRWRDLNLPGLLMGPRRPAALQPGWKVID
jgi:hypothetical protein